MGAARQKQVLVLYSTRRDAPDRRSSVTVSCRESSSRVWQQDLDYYSEYIDQGRFPDPEYQAGLQ